LRFFIPLPANARISPRIPIAERAAKAQALTSLNYQALRRSKSVTGDGDHTANRKLNMNGMADEALRPDDEFWSLKVVV
jgi:hypothetical protein